MKSKGFTLVSVLLIVLCLFLGGTSVYFYIQYNDKNDSQQPEPTKIDNSYILSQDVLDKFVFAFNNPYGEEYFGYFYKQNKTSIDTMDNKAKLYMAMQSLVSEDCEAYSISASDVLKNAKEIFGNDVTITHEDISFDGTDFVYNTSSKTYEADVLKCGKGGPNDSIYRKIVKQELKDDMLYVYTLFAYIDFNDDNSYDIYSDMSKNNKIGNMLDMNKASTLENKMSTYKLGFKIVNNVPVFKDIELVK